MYKTFYASTLVTLTVGTALGVAALWIPATAYDTAWRLFYTDVVLFVGSLAGAVISHYGDK